MRSARARSARQASASGWRRLAWVPVLLAELGLLAWGAMAALAPGGLPGPGGAPILPAGYEGFTGGSWQELVGSSPVTAAYITLLFRLYGAYIVAFGLLAVAVTVTAFRRGERWAWWSLLAGNTLAFGAAMAYDRIAGAIGPLEMSEYLGLAVVYGALAATLPRWSRDGRLGVLR